MKAMENLLYIPFRFEEGGTKVIHYTPENYETKDKDLKIDCLEE